MADSAKISEALRKLDPENDNHWTTTGQPRLETVRMVAGDQTISREDVDGADKDFDRNAARNAPAPAGGAVTGDPVPAVPNPGQTPDNTPPANVDGNPVPPPPPLPTAPPADGLPTAAEPIAVEGAEPQGTNVEQPTPATEGSAAPGRPPQITEGVTEKGSNQLNSPDDDLRDAQASTTPSGNAPAELGGHGDAPQGATNEAGGDESTEQRPGEAQLSPVDRGAVGDADEVKALEAELETLSAHTQELRGAADDAQSALSESLGKESALRIRIEQARPRGGTMPAIQDYFAKIDEVATKTAEARQALADSGVDWKQLEKLVKDPATGAIK